MELSVATGKQAGRHSTGEESEKLHSDPQAQGRESETLRLPWAFETS